MSVRRPLARVIFSCAVVFCALGCTTGQTESGTPQLLLQGRFSPGVTGSGIAGLPQTFSWAASSAFVSFQGSYITVSIQAVPQVVNTTYSINWFRFYIDGQAVQDGFTSYNQYNLTVTLTTSGSGTHTLKISKLNEGGIGEAVLQSLALSPGGRFTTTQPPASLASGRRILIFGDSYAVGFGVGGITAEDCLPTAAGLPSDWITVCTSLKVTNAPECARLWHNFVENSILAFGPLTAEALDADYELIASSGAGFTGYSYVESEYPGLPLSELELLNPTNQLVFNRSVLADANSEWPLTSWIPQVVVVGSGSNDLRAYDPDYTQDQWIQDALAFLWNISDIFNQPTIILLVFPAWNDSSSTRDGFNQTYQYEQGMPQLYSEAQSVGLPNIQMLTLANLSAAAYANWCDNHPSAAAHAAIASELSTFISTLQKGWSTNVTIDSAPSVSTIRPQTGLYTGANTAISPSLPSLTNSAPSTAPAQASAYPSSASAVTAAGR